MTAGSRVGRYELVERLGQGGMGEVFLARAAGPAGFEKTVVIKRLLPHLTSDPGLVRLFLQEARLASALSHPHIAQIFELAEGEDGYFIVMEHVPGHSLRAVLRALGARDERCPPEIAARWCAQALEALDHAHTLRGPGGEPTPLVHRDVSPENILVSSSGAVKLVDFGIAQVLQTTGADAAGEIRGKLGYMSPEQARGDIVDARADVYAAGVVLYELLEGARPFNDADSPALAQQMRAFAYEAVEPQMNQTPDGLRAIVTRALHPDPQARFQTAAQMAWALEEFIVQRGRALAPQQIASWLSPHLGAIAHSRSGTRSQKTAEILETRTVLVAPGSGGEALTVATKLERPTRAVLPSAEIEDVPRSAWKTRRGVLGAAAGLGLAAMLVLALGGVLGRGGDAERGAAVSALAAREAQTADDAVDPPASSGDGGERDVAPATVSLPGARPVSTNEAAPATAVAASAPVDAKTTAPSGSRPDRSSRVTKRKERYGAVVVWANPWATVFYEGRRLGITPLPATKLPAGRRKLTLRNDELGVNRTVTVLVPEGGEVVVRENLARP